MRCLGALICQAVSLEAVESAVDAYAMALGLRRLVQKFGMVERIVVEVAAIAACINQLLLAYMLVTSWCGTCA